MIEACTAPTINGPWSPLAVDPANPPEWTDNDPGGYGEAHVKTLAIPAAVRDSLAGTFLRLSGPKGPCFLGRIESKPLPDGEVMAYGHQTWLDDLVMDAGLAGTTYTTDFGLGSGTLTYFPNYGEGTYCETDMSGFKQDNNNTLSMVQTVNAGGLNFRVHAGETFSQGPAVGTFSLLTIGATKRALMPFTYSISNPDGAGYSVSIGIRAARRPLTPLRGIGVDSNTRSEMDIGPVTATSYTASGVFAIHEGQPVDYIVISVLVVSNSWVSTANPGTPTAHDIDVTFTGVRVNAVAQGTSVCPGTASTLIQSLTGMLPASVLPTGPAYQSCVRTDMTDMGRFIVAPADKLNDAIAKVLGVTGWRYGFWYRLVAGEWACVPVYEPHSTTPDYEAIEDGRADDPAGGVNANLMPGGIKDMASMTRVSYKLPDGTDACVDVTDDDATHLLRQRGIVRVRSISSDTHQQQTAAIAGATSNDTYGRSTLPGDVVVTRPIQTAAGGLVEPCDIESGLLLLLHSARYGDVTERVVAVKHQGRGKATLTLDDNPFSPKAIKRALRKGSVSAGGAVAGLA